MDFFTTYLLLIPLAPRPTHTLGKYKALPTLDDETISDLQMLITEDEVARAIATTPSGKSPSPDHFTPKFYKLFAPLLTSFLTKVFNSLWEGSLFPSTKT